ncbi:MAG: glycosyltransferase [Bacteroidetes bacterium]|nr:glycosyltransferase [Bacteroidota bacterium]
MNEALITIIIPTKDRPAVFNRTIAAALAAAEKANAEIIVVNDSKTAEPILPENDGRIRLVNNPKSGVAAARNLGESLARTPLLLFVDDDIVFEATHLEYTLNFLKQQPNNCLNLNWEYPPELIAACQKTAFGRFMIANQLVSLKGWRRGEPWFDELFEVPSGASCFLGITRSNFLRCEGYNEAFPHSGFEDFEFNSRMKKNGIKIFIEPNQTVLHNEVDKLDLRVWLKRNYHGANTIRIGFDMGYTQFENKTRGLKKFAYTILSPLEPFIFRAVNLIPNTKMFDGISFKGIHLLLGINIFKGYFRK